MKKKIYIQILGVIACLAVVAMHVNGCFWQFSYDRYWITANIIECICYFAVPIFFMMISPKSSHRRGGLAPRCRLVASWGCSRSQGLGCSPIKAARELGSERRETVRSLSVAGVGNLRGSAPSTRGPEWTYRWCTSCSAKSIAG